MTTPMAKSIAAAGFAVHEVTMRRRHWTLQWLGHPYGYAFGVPILTLLGAGTTLLAPMLLDPSAFGAFVLVTILFQYSSITDLGLSQLADREIAAKGAGREWSDDYLRARWIIALGVTAIGLPVAVMVALLTRNLAPLDAALAVFGGSAFMVANGPVTIHRAASRVWEFTTAALALQAGMTLPRIVGLIVGGVTGCAVALVLWYGTLSLLLARPVTAAVRPKPVRALLRAALPLFAFNGLWLIYLSANRWLSLGFSTPHDFGLFAFGANLASIAIGILSTVAQIRYPALLVGLAETPRGASSAALEKDALRLSFVLSVGVAAAMLLAQPIIGWMFPRFDGATPATIGLAVSCVPLGVVAWTLPISIGLTRQPWRSAVLIFAPALAMLVAAMMVGDRAAGIVGQAWGCVAAAVVLLVAHVGLMHNLGIVTTRACLRITLLQTTLVSLLVGLAFTSGVAFDVPNAAQNTPPLGWKLAFEDNFESLSLWDGKGGVWEPHYPWGARTNPPNQELEYYVDPRAGRDPYSLANLAPFDIKDGTLTIRAQQIPAPARRLALNLQYASGLPDHGSQLFNDTRLCGNARSRTSGKRLVAGILAHSH